jgi:NADH-quinone oxidoreductase subunit G
VPSVCPHCGCGCATQLNVRGTELTRTRPRESPEVNDIWLCDKGFFGYEFTSSPQRLTVPLVRQDGALREIGWDAALDRVAEALRASPREQIGVMGGARITNEEAYLLLQLFRGVLGTNHIDFRTDTAHPLPTSEAPWGLDIAIADVERADVIVLVGCDLTEEYPIIWLRVKKAVDRGARLIIINPWALEIARWAWQAFVPRWGTESLVLRTLAGTAQPEEAARAAEVSADHLKATAAAVAGARRALVLVGAAALERPDGREMLTAAEGLRPPGGGADLGILRGRGNSGGAQLLGLLPDMLPGYRPLGDDESRSALGAVWGRSIPSAPGHTVRGMLEAARAGSLRVLYAVGADPASDYPDARAWTEARRGLGCLVVQELFLTPTAAVADVVLPALSYAEKSGTVCNIEGRVQRQAAALLGPGSARSDALIFSQIASRLGADVGYASWEEIFSHICRVIPGCRDGARLAPPRPQGPADPQPLATPYAGAAPGEGLILLTGSRLFDRGTMARRCPGIRAQAGEPFVALHPDDAAQLGVADGMPCQVQSPRGHLRVAARVWSGLCRGHAFIPRGYETAPVHALLDERGPVTVTVRALIAADAAG